MFDGNGSDSSDAEIDSDDDERDEDYSTGTGGGPAKLLKATDRKGNGKADGRSPKKVKTKPTNKVNRRFAQGFNGTDTLKRTHVETIMNKFVLSDEHLEQILKHFNATLYLRSFLGHCTNCK